MNIRIISAGAGSGKTYRLTKEMVELLKPGQNNSVRAAGIIATTFTKKAATELKERVRVSLLTEGLSEQADDLANAMIGTVHSIGVKLLKRFAFEAGVSPEVDIIADEDMQVMFNESLAAILHPKRIKEMEQLAERLGLNKKERYDWRQEIRSLTEIARANNFAGITLQESCEKSLQSLFEFIPPLAKTTEEEFNQELRRRLSDTLTIIRNNEDSTKTTQKTINAVQAILNNLNVKGELNWHEWVKLQKEHNKIGKKSRDDYYPIAEWTALHNTHPRFHRDIREFITNIFHISIEALEEYDYYKKRRGLIDYTDMEVSVLQLLDNKQVQEVLKDELDLLMVDEFQDTNPIQLEIFLKLSRLANQSIWVGDPKQSIYGFRGAEPELMQAIIRKMGGIKEEDILKYSWRSREDLVYIVNALFCKAFQQLPAEQIALNPQRTKAGNQFFETEPIQLETALKHWHFEHEGNRTPNMTWMNNCIAHNIRQMLEAGIYIIDRETGECRKAEAGDIAVLCRSNKACIDIADALHQAGLKAAIARSGLTFTAEVQLILACLKYILHRSDSLSVAEILRLAGNYDISHIIQLRLEYLAKKEAGEFVYKWDDEHELIKQLDELREQVVELSGSEILNLVLEELELKRIIATWGNVRQRFDNVDALRKMALQYEDTCNRLHTAASLSGFLLWLNEKANDEADEQGARENPDAINVMTYHRSKGLEWNIVICHNLENTLRDKVWGMNIISEQDEVDLNAPLANRWLRYWINPYSDQVKGTALNDAISTSPVKEAATLQALQEEARLLYVGLTRARDYLVFPTRKSSTKWLNRVWNEGDESTPTLDLESYESPWEWSGNLISIDTKVQFYEKIFQYIQTKDKETTYLEKRLGGQSYPMLKPDIILDAPIQFNITKQIEIEPVKVHQDIEEHHISALYKAFLYADQPQEPSSKRNHIANHTISQFNDIQTKSSDILPASTSFYLFVENQFEIKRILKNYPIVQSHHQQVVETVADILLETPKGLIVIQFCSQSVHIQKTKSTIKELIPALHYIKNGLKNCAELWVYFGISGVLTKIELPE